MIIFYYIFFISGITGLVVSIRDEVPRLSNGRTARVDA